MLRVARSFAAECPHETPASTRPLQSEFRCTENDSLAAPIALATPHRYEYQLMSHINQKCKCRTRAFPPFEK
ncbi:hypothetical protein D3C84_1191530 [compost metagenome]